MSDRAFVKQVEEFCPRCEHLDSKTGICYEIRENIGQFPVKFRELCNGEYFSLERNSTLLHAKLDLVQQIIPVEEETELNKETAILKIGVEQIENLERSTKNNLEQQSLKANKRIINESVCGVCGGEFFIGEDINRCKTCGNFYHSRCWDKKGECRQIVDRSITKTN